MTGYEKTGYEIAAQVLGMKVSEIRDIDPVDGGAVVTTHDGQRHGINDAGELVPLLGAFNLPEPVLHQSGPAPQLVPGELIPGTTTTANEVGEGGALLPNEHHLVAGLSLQAVATVIATEFNLPAVAVLDVLDAEFGDSVPEVIADETPDVDEHQADVDDELADDEPVEPGPVDADQVPTGNADHVLEWVGDDRDRARRALEVEEAKTAGKRGTLVTKLTRLVGAE
jgi:hypothetical protein